MRSVRSNLLRYPEGQSLLETAFLLPFLLTIVFNAVNLGYFFFVFLNLTTAPRQGAEYSIQGAATILQGQLATADDVSTLVNEDISGAIASAADAPRRVCTMQLGLVNKGTASQVPACNLYGSRADPFSAQLPDPEAPYLVLNRVDIQYTVAPLISGKIFNIALPPSLALHRLVYMRVEN
jgi:Flp pilus assembly protein TadG